MKRDALLLVTLSICLLFAFKIPAQTNVSGETNAPAISEAEVALRSNLHLQEQLHHALRAIEEARQDADEASKQTAELFTEKLNAVEKNLALQRERDLETIIAMRESNRVALTAGGILAGIGILALMVTAYFQIRAMNRVAQIGALVSSSVSIDGPHALGNGATVPAQLNSSDEANARFLAAIERLEKRIHELDGTNFKLGNGAKRIELVEQSSNGHSNGSETPVAISEADSLLIKGQDLLNQGEPEKALACFEEALKLDETNTEALLKKGSALEALRKLPEAIEAYDQAIAKDKTLTVAYLYKGGVLNRLQRFGEAMQCYEQALAGHPESLSR